MSYVKQLTRPYNVPRGKPCDMSTCNHNTTVEISVKTTNLCASWFIGFYCRTCAELQLEAFDKENKKETANVLNR